MQQAVSIREMVERDLAGYAELHRLQLEYHAEWFDSMDPSWIGSDESNRLTIGFVGVDDHIALVAEANGRLKAFLPGKILADHPASIHKKIADLSSIFVRENQRGKGIGRQLINRFLQFCRNNEATLVTVRVAKANDPTREFYHGLGFKDFLITMHLPLET